MSWFSQLFEPEPEEVDEPWMVQPFVVNDKQVTLRDIRRHAVEMADEDNHNSIEQGLAMTIVALVDELSWLHAQLLDKGTEE